MKQKIFALLLAMWMALSLLPVTAQASQEHRITAGIAGEAHGTLVLAQDRAAAGETVWLRAEPEEGYLVQISGTGDVRICYAGLGLYTLTMPDGDVEVQVRFVPAEGALYPVTGTVVGPEGGTLTICRTEAREGEWVTVEAAPNPGFVLEGLTAMGTDGLPVKGGYADTRDGVWIYEYCLPDAGIVIEARFTPAAPAPIRAQLTGFRHRLIMLWGEAMCF